MDVEQLKDNLLQAIAEDYGDLEIRFCDQDGDETKVNLVYLDEDKDVCLEFGDNPDQPYTVQRLLDELLEYDDDAYVYVYNEELNLCFDIDIEDEDEDEEYDGLWYEDEGCIYLDTTYNEEDYEPEEEDEEK